MDRPRKSDGSRVSVRRAVRDWGVGMCGDSLVWGVLLRFGWVTVSGVVGQRYCDVTDGSDYTS